MRFISYAQNFEDVMLWRALKHVKNGTYVDVGANDPSEDSVTKAFYDRGWSGINIEPLYSHFVDLNRARPRDTNLRCAAGEQSGELNLWECDVRGWSTADPVVIAQHEATGHVGKFHRVAVRTLSSILDRHSRGDIHFLKIDVEGFEQAVIRGMDFSRHRPWILVIESTRPNAPDEQHEDWEKIVLNNDYLPVYFDGLNRFYLAQEHHELAQHFRLPPNVFDHFVHAHEQTLQDIVAGFLNTGQLNNTSIELESQVMALRAEIDLIYSSQSWHLTRPLRWINHQLKLLIAHGPKERLKAIWRKWSVGRDTRQLPEPAVVAMPDIAAGAPSETVQLSPHVQSIYRQLMAQINASQP